MSLSPISYISDFAVDLSRIKCIKVIAKMGEKSALVFEFNGRAIYSQHPETAAWEKEIIYESVSLDYESYEDALGYFRDWVECWQEYHSQI